MPPRQSTQDEWDLDWAQLAHKKAELEAKKQSGKASALQTKLSAVQTGVSVGGTLVKVITAALIFFVIIGPGTAAIMQVFGAMNLWMWIGAIALLIILFGRR